jgi:Na+/proline symporter/signal transduction histidine kinase
VSAWVIAVLVLLYVGLIFGVAGWGERHADDRLLRRHGGLVMSFALAVYCTSWTYYGAVGSAVRHGWDYVPIYLGPMLLFLFGQPFLRKLAFVARKQNVTSIAHFVSARYGKRRNIARLAALTCFVVVVPYIALQLKAVSASYQVLLGAHAPGDGASVPLWQDSALLSAIAMTVFAILFGTGRIMLTEQRRGLLLAIAFESVVKLVALVALAVAAFVFLLDREPSVLAAFVDHAQEHVRAGGFSAMEFATQTVLAMAAVFLLPRQFHVAFIENDNPDTLRQSRYGFTIYLAIVTLVVVPIAVAGMRLFPGELATADQFVLLIPAESGWHGLSVLVFLGGFSAATSMIIVATLALSIMLSNEIVMPALLRGRAAEPSQDLSRRILFVRRSMIVLVMALAYAYYSVFARNYELAETGLLAFALVIQLAPAVVGGLYWRGGNAWGVYAGLAAGLGLWFATLVVPQLANLGLLPGGPGAAAAPGLAPGALTQGVLLSLGVNVLAYVLVSINTEVGLQDRLQASAFVNPNLPPDVDPQVRRAHVSTADLQALLERFVGRERAQACLAEFAGHEHALLDTARLPDVALIAHVERELAGVIGASSAVAVISAILERRQLGVEDVVTLFDDTQQVIQFSRTILNSTLEHLGQGVSVVDKDLNLVAWNRAYLDLFDYPEGMIRVGKPVAEIVRYNAGRGLCGPGSVQEHVEKRINHMRRGNAHVFQRIMPDGRVVEMRGNPIPGGGFVTSFTDISEYVRSVTALAEARDSLERRVQERTQTITEINQELLGEIARRCATEQQLLAATALAESANASKTRFLALASHDILQPLNAARLFTAALAAARTDERRNAILGQLDKSLAASEELISTLLEIAKLEDGRMQPELRRVNLKELLSQLADEYELLASQKGLQLWVRIAEHTVVTDPTYLRRILQNLLSNAVKYTQGGTILVSCEVRGERVTIDVRDTGPGIAAHDLEHIFDDFYRVQATAAGAQGLGLGLGVVSRMARLLGHELAVKSDVGQGSVFSITLPLAAAPAEREPAPAATAARPLPGLSVLCVDDDDANLAALKVLLEQWEIRCEGGFHAPDTALAHAAAHAAPDVVIIDYQLGRDVMDGLALFVELRRHWPAVQGILVSAAPEPDLAARAREAGLLFLAKPIKPGALRASLNHLRTLRRTTD